MKRILIVDDIEQNRYLLETTLRGYGYGVTSARDGAEALAAARRQTPDLVISDILMPVMDGFCLCRQWRADKRLCDIPFIFFTATYTDAKDEQLALDLGADRFVLKPQEPQVMNEIVRDVLAGGAKTAVPGAAKALPDEIVTLREYNEALVRKLEKKLNELEATHQQLLEDICRRQETEEALREKTLRLEMSVQGASLGIWHWDIQTDIVTTLQGSGPISGLPEGVSPKTGAAFFALVHPEDRGHVDERVRRAIEGREEYQVEFRILLPDETVRWVAARGRCFHDAAGKALLLTGVDMDITERKQAEEALRESQERFAKAFRASPAAMGIATLEEGRILEVNDSFLRLTGYSRDEVVDRSTIDIGLWSSPDVRARFMRALRRRGTLRDLETRFLTKSGEVRYGLGSTELIDLGGQRCTLGILNDITERKRAEEALRQAEEKYRTIFENAVEGIFRTTADGRFITANPALARMLGFDSPEELIREHSDGDRTSCMDPQRRDEFRRSLDENGFVRGFEYQGRRKDGTKIWLSDSVRAVRDQSGTLLYYEGIAEDITERKQAEIRSTAFATLAQKLSGARIPADAARIIVDTADELLGWDACTLHLHDADRDLVYPVLNIDTINGQRVDLTLSAAPEPPSLRARQIMNQGATLILREEPYEFDAHSVPYGDISRPSASIMCVPVRRASTVVGLLSIQSYTPHAYDDAALNDLQALADYCGEALNRIRAEASLYENEQRFRQIAENLEDVLWMTDREAKNVLYINSAYEAVWGRSCESLYKRLLTFAEAVHSDDRETVQRMLEMHAAGKHEPFEYRIVKPDGSTRWIRDRSFPIRNNEGEVYRIAGIAEDITERKRAEAALQESEERFRQLSEAAFEAIIIHDNETILEVNQSFCRMYGYERAEMIGKSVLDLALPELREQLLQIVRSGDTGPYESPALRKNGTVFKAEVVGKPIHYQGRVARVAAIRDITEQKRIAQRQAAQYAVTRVLAESATVAEATPQLLRVICETLRWKMGEFWRVCNSTRLLRCVETWYVPTIEATAFIEASRQTELAPNAGLPGRVWQSGQPAWIPDVMTDPRFARAAIAAKAGLRGAVAFPILLGNHTLGVMLFFSRRTPEVDEDLLKMMSAIGSQIGQFIERKHAEEALRESQQRLRSILNNSPSMIFLKDSNGRYLDCNPAFEKICALGRDQIIGKTDRELFPAEQAAGFRSNDLKVLEAGRSIEFEETALHSDGPHVSIVSKFPLREAGGSVYALGGIVTDITELKRAEGALRQTEQQYESLVHSIDGIVWEADPRTFSFTFVSKQAERLLGYPLAQWLSEPNFWANHIHPDDREWAVVFCLKAIARREHHRFEYRMIATDGRAVWLKDNVTVSIMGDESVRLRGVMVDITERKLIEEALRGSEERYRELFENATDAIYIHDLKGRYTSLNRAAERLTGYSREEILGRHFSNFVAPRNLKDVRESLCKKLDEVHETVYEIDLVTKDRRRVPVEVISRLIYENGVAVGVQGTARDITDRRRAEETTRIFSRRLIEAQEAERQRIARELHDQIGQVLTAVKLNLHTVQSVCDQPAALPHVEDSIRVLDEALDQVRDLSLDLRPSLLDDLGLVTALGWYAERQAQRTGVRAEILNGFPDQDVRFSHDLETACFRIAQEALTNVARHAQAQRVSVRLQQDKSDLLLIIEDDGIGFDVKSLRQHAAGTATLGLRGMQERARAVDGTIEIDSAPSEGTRIRCRFPTRAWG